MRRLLAVLVLLGALGGAVGSVSAQGNAPEVRAYIQPDQGVTEQQSVRLIIEVDGEGSPQLSAGGLSRLKNLQIVAGPERRFNSTWANGRLSARTSLVYTLVPQSPGPAEIPALALQIDGKPATTQPIRFDVAPAPAGVPQRPAPSRSRGGTSNASADVFMRTQLGADEVWLGESVSLSVLIYGGERISGPSLAGQPSLSSFWVEDLEVDPQRESSQATVDGRSYAVFPMIRKILVPQTAGDIEIEPFVMRIPVRARSGDPYESLFSFGRTQNVVRKTQPVTLRVRPLPDAGRPDDFSGAVGRYELETSMDRQEAAINDAVALTATVEGHGFLRAVSPPTLDLPPDIKVFDPKVSSSSRIVRGELVSRKTWEWILVPLVAGELKIPELRFSYFDTESGSYSEAASEPFRLVVQQSGDGPQPSQARGDIRLQRRDLAFIKPSRETLRQSTPRAHRRGLFTALLLLPLVWAPLAILVGRHRAKLNRDLGLVRSRRARSRAKQRLRAVGKRLEAADGASFHEEVARALVEYVADRFDRSAAGLTYEVADDLLASKGLDPDLRRRFRSCLETCDFARFVPSASASDRRSEVLEEAEQLIERLEKAL